MYMWISSVDSAIQGVTENMRTSFGHELHIPKQEQMFLLTCARKRLICVLLLKEYTIIGAQNVFNGI
jgi:hypothetical protein